MALTHLAFALFLAMMQGSRGNDLKNVTSAHHGNHTTMNPERRNAIVEETFKQQKDVLLDILESKLKEVRDKKIKKKAHHDENNNNNAGKNVSPSNCDALHNIDVKLNVNGISALGEADLQLKNGNTDKFMVNIESNGISNVGKAVMEVDIGGNAMHIPGLSNLFPGCFQNRSIPIPPTDSDDIIGHGNAHVLRSNPSAADPNSNGSTDATESKSSKVDEATLINGTETVLSINTAMGEENTSILSTGTV